MQTADSVPGSRLTPIQWLICAIAAIGFAFDIYEILMLPLIVRPALLELTGAVPGSPEFQMWVGRLFYIPAFAGGIFGLLGGYMTDRFGRRRVLTYSILIYALAAFVVRVRHLDRDAALPALPRVHRRLRRVRRGRGLAGRALPRTEAAREGARLHAGVLVARRPDGGDGQQLLRGEHAAALPALDAFGSAVIQNPHAPWRYTLMSGVIPAIPLILIRPFLPESPVWRQRKEAGTLRRPSIAELFAPALRRTTIVTTVMFAMAYGAAFGAIQQIPQIVPGLPEVREMVASQPPPQARLTEQGVAASVTKFQEIGGLAGRVALAWLAVVIVSRRKLIRMFQIPGLILMPIVFGWAARTDLQLLYPMIFLAGFFTVAQFSFWGNYLPRVYPVHLRGTGESFAANIGGRLIGTSFAWVTATLAVTANRAYAPTKVALVAAGVGFTVYLVGLIASAWLPEPPEETAE